MEIIEILKTIVVEMWFYFQLTDGPFFITNNFFLLEVILKGINRKAMTGVIRIVNIRATKLLRVHRTNGDKVVHHTY